MTRDKDASLWVYINEKGDRVCPWLETGSENSLQTSCLTAEQLENASISSSAQGGSTMTTSYGVVPDEAKCILLKLKNGGVTKAPVTQNGWLVGTTHKNPVMDAKSTTASCS